MWEGKGKESVNIERAGVRHLMDSVVFIDECVTFCFTPAAFAV